MASLGYDMESGRVGKWLKSVGDRVARGEPLCEVETDKATIDIESMQAGTLVEITAQAGVEVPVGDVIGYLEVES